MDYHCTIKKEGDEYIAQFPDMTNIVTCGFSKEEALVMAKEALEGILELDIEQGRKIPLPRFTGGYSVQVSGPIAQAIRQRISGQSPMETHNMSSAALAGV